MCSRTGASAPMVENEAHSSCMLRPPLRPAGRSGNGRRAGPRASSSVRPPDQTLCTPLHAATATHPPTKTLMLRHSLLSLLWKLEWEWEAHQTSGGCGHWLGGGSASRWCERPFAECNQPSCSLREGRRKRPVLVAERAIAIAAVLLRQSHGSANKPGHSRGTPAAAKQIGSLRVALYYVNPLTASLERICSTWPLCHSLHSLKGRCEASAHCAARNLLFLLAFGLSIGHQTRRHSDMFSPLHQTCHPDSRLLEHSTVVSRSNGLAARLWTRTPSTLLSRIAVRHWRLF